MKNVTKQKLIKMGAKAMLEKSYHAVGIQEILTEVGVPKGSFYYYFDSKEDFGVAIIEYYGEQLANNIKGKLLDSTHSPRERMFEYYLGIRNFYAVNGCGQGCLIAKFATEVANLSPLMRVALKKEFDKWLELFSTCIREGQLLGEINSDLDPESLAEFLYTSWEGVLIRMQVNQNLTPIDNFINYAFDRIILKTIK